MRHLRAGGRRLDGAAGLAAVAPHYDDLLGSAPLTARWQWLSTWARTHPTWRPLTVIIDGPDGPDGIALLAHRRRGPLLEVTALGHGQSDYARFAVRPQAVPLLAEGICRAIWRLPGPCRVRLDGFPADDPVLKRVAQVLPGAVLLDGDGAPVIPLTPNSDPMAGGRREARVMARRGHNRLRTDGRAPRIEVVSAPSDVAARLPELERLHRARDHAVRGLSDFDDPENVAFWYAVCVEAADRGELELSTLRVDGELAAYIIAFCDEDAYRVWDPRIAPAHARYNPGHVLRADVLSRVAAMGRFTEFDWMRGVERYKLATTSTVVATERLLGWRPAWVHRVEPALRSAHARVSSAAAVRSGRNNAGPAPSTPSPAGPAPNSTLAAAPSRSAVLAELVDQTGSGPVLVVGSLPPFGRDLDLLVVDDDVPGLADALRAAGFAPGPEGWSRWVWVEDRVRADTIEVLTADDWGLDAAQHQWMRAGAIRLPGHLLLHRPAPAAALLILARRYAAAGGVLTASWSERIAAAVQEERGAWDLAAAHAPSWQLSTALSVMRAHAAGATPSAIARYRLAREHRTGTTTARRLLRVARRTLRAAPPRHRPTVVALSGLDGAGKTSQAALLVSALQDLGLTAAPGWSRLSYRQWLWNLDRALSVVVQLVRRSGPTPQGPDAPSDELLRPHRRLRQRSPVLTWAWAWVVTLDAVVAQRRLLRAHRDVDIVACDRYALDSAVHLLDVYGPTVDVTLHTAAVRALLPRPLTAFLLRIESTTAYARKPDDRTVEQLERQARLYDRQLPYHQPTVVLNGDQPTDELARHIAEYVHSEWAAASRSPLSGRRSSARRNRGWRGALGQQE